MREMQVTWLKQETPAFNFTWKYNVMQVRLLGGPPCTCILSLVNLIHSTFYDKSISIGRERKRAQKGNHSSIELVGVGDLVLYLLVEIRIKIIVLVLSLD